MAARGYDGCNRFENGMYLLWVMHLYIYLGTLEDAQIPHAFNSVFLVSYALFKGLLFACHQLVLTFLIIGKLEDARFSYAFNSVFLFLYLCPNIGLSP